MNEEHTFSTCVVMSTYNGSKYIVEQMDSIRKQTVPVERCYIYDDLSTDGTYDIVLEYIKKYSLHNWIVSINNSNLGWRMNFLQGFEKAKEDLIFPSDQDDIWPLDKVETAIRLFTQNKDMLLLRGKSVDILNSEQIEKTHFFEQQNCENDEFSYQEFHKPSPGCALCFKNEFFRVVKKYYYEGESHDAFLIHMARVLGGAYRTNKNMVFHRVHQNNTFSTERKLNSYRTYYINKTERFLKMNHAMRSAISDLNCYSEEKYNILSFLESWSHARIDFLRTKRFIYALKLIKYVKCYGKSGLMSSCKHYLTEIYHTFTDHVYEQEI